MAIGVFSTLLVLLCARLQVQAAPGFSGAHANLAKRHAPDEVLVQYRAGVTAAQKGAARGRAAAESVQTVSDHGKELELVRMRGKSVAEAILAIGQDANVEFVEPNYVLEPVQDAAGVTDAYFAGAGCQLWGMYGPTTTPCANQFGSNAAAAWADGNTGSNNVYVGVVDEGIQVGVRGSARWGRRVGLFVCVTCACGVAACCMLAASAGSLLEVFAPQLERAAAVWARSRCRGRRPPTANPCIETD
jgi:hypothetical protein